MRNRKTAKKAGTSFEAAVASYLAENVDRRIERRARNGARDKGDVAGVIAHGIPIVVECKNEVNPRISGYLREMRRECENAGTVAGVVAMKRIGIGIDKDSRIDRHCVITDETGLRVLMPSRQEREDAICGRLKYDGKYRYGPIMDLVESGDGIRVVLQEARYGGYFYVTSLGNLAKMLSMK